MSSSSSRRWSGGLVAALLVCLASVTWAGEEPLIGRRFTLVHRPLDEAYRLISPLLSERAEVTVIRAERRLEVRDEAARLEAIEQRLRSFDVAPRAVKLTVRAIVGEKRPGGSGGEVPGLPPDVRELLGFNSFETMGTVDLALNEGGSAAALLGADARYRVAVELGAVDASRGAVQVKLLSLDRRLQGAEGETRYRPVLQLGEELQSGRPRVLCATPSASHRRALFLLVVASTE